MYFYFDCIQQREAKKKGEVLDLKALDDNNMDIDDDDENVDEQELKEKEKKDDNKKMDVDKDDNDKDKKDEKKDGDADEIKVTLMPLKEQDKKRKFYPETYIFLELLLALELYDRNKYEEALEILLKLINFIKEQNRRTSDLLSSRLYQFYALTQQRLGKLSSITIRKKFYDDYQIACLQQNESAQSILIVLILQCYISLNLYNLANKFVDKADFPELSESQYYARYHYYRARIDCVQLQYSDALYKARR